MITMDKIKQDFERYESIVSYFRENPNRVTEQNLGYLDYINYMLNEFSQIAEASKANNDGLEFFKKCNTLAEVIKERKFKNACKN